MSNENKAQSDLSSEPDEPGPGVNLKLIYSLLALAILAAITIAVFIVLPFYQRR